LVPAYHFSSSGWSASVISSPLSSLSLLALIALRYRFSGAIALVWLMLIVGVLNPIGSTAAFAHFQEDHADRRQGGVDQQTATLVGAYIMTIG
jgi:hypothetical protein